jgi:hypothetical protein
MHWRYGMRSDFLNIGFVSSSEGFEVQVETTNESGLCVSLIHLPRGPNRDMSRAITIDYEDFVDLVGQDHWLVQKVDKLREVLNA